MDVKSNRAAGESRDMSARPSAELKKSDMSLGALPVLATVA
jgi:hypothetical protein